MMDTTETNLLIILMLLPPNFILYYKLFTLFIKKITFFIKILLCIFLYLVKSFNKLKYPGKDIFIQLVSSSITLESLIKSAIEKDIAIL